MKFGIPTGSFDSIDSSYLKPPTGWYNAFRTYLAICEKDPRPEYRIEFEVLFSKTATISVKMPAVVTSLAAAQPHARLLAGGPQRLMSRMMDTNDQGEPLNHAIVVFINILLL